MTIPPEKTQEIKEQLLKQIDQSKQENKEQIKEYIKKLNPDELEEFLKQNKIQMSDSGPSQSQTPEKPIFQSIVKGEMPSYKIAENKKAIAILEINPLSKGHSIVLPREQTTIDKLPKTALSLAQKIAKKIKSKLKPDDIKIETASFQEYPMINIIPIYKDKPLNKYKEDEKVLQKLQKKLETKKRATRTSPKSSSSLKPSKNLPEISFRIP